MRVPSALALVQGSGGGPGAGGSTNQAARNGVAAM